MTKPRMDGGILGRPRRRKNHDASTSPFLPLQLEGNLLGYRTPLPSGEPPVDRGPPNPAPELLKWDPSKQAFRLIDPPTHCDWRTHKSAFGERLTCGLCDGRRELSHRFQSGLDVRHEPRCGYCGELTGNTTRICDGCQKIKERLMASGITGDDQILVGIHRALAATARREQREEEVDEIKQRRMANRRRAERRLERATH